ncbi:MAG TPA: IclR family transcriptional regulator [Burkholderiaceae bacterium]|nr:IclR family transcriptional regulator [Burkholderiaceae bacterium]
MSSRLAQAPAAGKALVPAVQRASRLLDHLAQAREPVTLAALVRELSLPKSSMHGLLATLVELDLVRRLPAGEFALGPRVLQWANGYTSQTDIVGAFNEHAGRIDALRAETVMLAVLDEADVVYLACRPGSRPLAVNFRVGGRFPATCTSSGKAMLSTQPDQAVRSRLAASGLRRLTRHSIGSMATLLRQLGEAREHGYAVDDEETAEGMYCFGAPVFSAGQHEATAAVAVSLIKATVTPRRRNETVAAITELAALLSERLGGSGQRPVHGRRATARNAA